MNSPIDAGNNYSYLPDFNIIVNNAFLDIFLKNAEDREIKIKDTDINIAGLKNNVKDISQVLFEVTQHCNLKCRYCVYNGDYYFARNKSNLSLEFETAKGCLDYINKLISARQKKELTISFYGGEPLLNSDLIKRIVNYSKALFGSWKLSYAITTNGTNFDTEIIDFFISNDFQILISLDGSQKNHDAKRIYPDGEGSFKDTWANILEIKRINEEYFNNKVSISATYSHDLSLKESFDFFLNNKVINKNFIRFSKVGILDTDYFKKHDVYPGNERDLDEIFSRIKEKVKTKKELENSIENVFCNLDLTELDFDRYTTLAGCCNFSSKVFIDVKGRFHICEKMNDKFSIGNVYDGFDFDKMQEITRRFVSIFKRYCMKCEVKFLCSPCYVPFAKDGSLKFDRKFCEARKRTIFSNLKEYVELNCLAFEARCSVDLSSAKKFHQFVKVERGPVNTAIFDFLKGNVFQTENKVIDEFNNFAYDRIPDFIKSAAEEEIIIDVYRKAWIPKLYQDESYPAFINNINKKTSFRLEIEAGIDIGIVKEKFKGYDITQVIYYGVKNSEPFFPGVEVKCCEKDFSKCLEMSKINGKFNRIDQERYYLNKKFNYCWAHKVAVTGDMKIRPCIYSEIVVGDLKDDDIDQLFKKIKKLWHLTKDEVEKCKDCELRYLCFDCRELARRESSNLYAPNPYCNYDPFTGVWSE